MNASHNSSVWAVVLGWNHAEDTIECLHSLSASQNVRLQLVFVDNGSTEDQVEKVAAEAPAGTVILRHPKNVGVSRGYNAGLKYALEQGADYVVMANNDTAVEPDAVELLVQAAENDPATGILVPKINYYSDRNVIWSAGARFRKVPPIIIMQKTPGADDGRFDHRCSLEFTTLCTVLIRAEALKKSGLINPNYVYYCEDYDLALRIRKAGYSVRLVPAAKTYHKVERVTRDGSSSPQFWQNYGRSEAIFRRHFPRHWWMTGIPHLAYLQARNLYEGGVSAFRNFRHGYRLGKSESLRPIPAWNDAAVDPVIHVNNGQE
jgi:GT2 family glycosyltransferase